MGSILWVPVIFSAATTLLYGLSISLPAIDSSHADLNNTSVKFPSNLEELSSLATLLSAYKEQHLVHVLVLFSAAYLWKQTFAIPGSVFMNLLAGALFGPWIGFPLACVLTAIGATNCYMLSKYFGKAYITKHFPDRIRSVQQKIEENLDSLFFFLLFLRLFPMSPNWFMNMVAPILQVPVHLFFFSVFIGLMPYNFICVQTGCFLSELTSLDDIFSLWTLGKLMVVANAALLPGLLLQQHHKQRAIDRRRAVAEATIRQKEQELLELERKEAELALVKQRIADMARSGVQIEEIEETEESGDEGVVMEKVDCVEMEQVERVEDVETVSGEADEFDTELDKRGKGDGIGVEDVGKMDVVGNVDEMDVDEIGAGQLCSGQDPSGEIGSVDTKGEETIGFEDSTAQEGREDEEDNFNDLPELADVGKVNSAQREVKEIEDRKEDDKHEDELNNSDVVKERVESNEDVMVADTEATPRKADVIYEDGKNDERNDEERADKEESNKSGELMMEENEIKSLSSGKEIEIKDGGRQVGDEGDQETVEPVEAVTEETNQIVDLDKAKVNEESALNIKEEVKAGETVDS